MDSDREGHDPDAHDLHTVDRDRIRYELTFELDDPATVPIERERLTDAILGCLTVDGVQGFWAERRVGGRHGRLTFEFDDESAWERFRDSDGHAALVTTLEDGIAAVERELWGPGAVSLGEDGPLVVPLERVLPGSLDPPADDDAEPIPTGDRP
ncbi:hypothetical protein [Salinilacihabitans rarus]|uniref:hypothetical protein n=1 Tax=Salinilacihabitans rarus TaxID=2961596 RepID=UPI0020C834C1|nr:hypothetical protein [Salinilacihabitans rarus]